MYACGDFACVVGMEVIGTRSSTAQCSWAPRLPEVDRRVSALAFISIYVDFFIILVFVIKGTTSGHVWHIWAVSLPLCLARSWSGIGCPVSRELR